MLFVAVLWFMWSLRTVQPQRAKEASMHLIQHLQRLNGPKKGLWSIYRFGVVIGYGIRPQFNTVYGEFGP